MRSSSRAFRSRHTQKGGPAMPASFLLVIGIFIGSLIVLNFVAAAFGTDSRPVGPVRWI